MQTINVTQSNGISSCDINISKEEWLEILEDKATQKEYIETLLRFYYMPEHKGSCTQVSRKQGGNARVLNLYVKEFGNLVKDKLNRFEVIGTEGRPIYWIIPMGQGKTLSKSADGSFEWQLRKELVEAIRIYLYRHLVKQYKELRKELPIDSSEYAEIYKWKLIDDCKGKDTKYIIQRLSKENLIDVSRDAYIIKYMLTNHEDEYIQILDNLVHTDLSLNERLEFFKNAMVNILPKKINGKNIVGQANDERIASAILTCHNPKQYTFYKYDVYIRLCKYLGIKKQNTGKRFEHFLEILKPLQQIAEHDNELHAIIAESLKGYESNSLLLAQDVLWEILVCYPQKLDFIYSLVWKPCYWFVGFNFEKHKSQLERFTKEGIWEAYIKEGNKQISEANKIKEDDILILKSTFTRGKTHKKSCLRISAIAIVTNKQDNVKNDNGYINVKCNVEYINCDVKEFEEKGYGNYLSTIMQCEEATIIDYVNKTRNMEPQNKYKNYIDLLRANYNLVLTGAPGTGKTYLAKEIAKEMGAEWEIVQFHPSYDYTDFVEGMRPKDDDNGNIGFERKDGIFKAFCGKALENYVDSMKSKETLQQEKSAQELLEDFIDEAMENGTEFHTSGTNNRFYISDNKEYHIIIKAPDNEKVQSVILRKSELLTLLEKNIKIIEKKEIQNYFQRKYSTQQDSYTFVIYQILQKRSTKATNKDIQQVTKKPYVFIIDEINRGETSKIFGELFYSIDPGYRGEKGRVNTQYQNMIEDGNIFQKGFYVPENVYIIGTMNDIDRSVESMDFAMRRRLAWKEVTAEESFESMIENDTEFSTLKNEIKLRMTKLNQAILKKELGLGKAYQIGAAYFRKVAKYAELDPEIAFDMLWDYHLSGLLAEYLRGNRNAAKQLQILHQAYNNKETENDALNEG